jgi:hypothetical protein
LFYFCPGWPWTAILLPSTSHTAGIADVCPYVWSKRALLKVKFKFYVVL